MQQTPPAEIVEAFDALRGASFRRFGTGLINATFLVERDGRRTHVLQGLHPAFGGVVNDDIDALTTHLASRGLTTPRIVRARDGATWRAAEDGQPWRVLTYVDGDAFDKIDGPRRAYEAGRLAGRFHAAVADFEHRYAFTRQGVHDGAAHASKLRDALDAHPEHRLASQVRPLAERAIGILETLMPRTPLAARHAHGDLKLSNLLFDASGAGVCLIDLDTIARMPLMFEVGDALRSWTNPKGEDVLDARVDREIFDSALRGFASSCPALSEQERESIPLGLPYIAAGLTARFLTDALEERYFGWRADKYATRGEHNLVRAKGQLSLAEDAMLSRDALEAIARDALG